MTRAHFHLYAVFMMAATLAAIWSAAKRPPEILRPSYWRWLLVPWKLATAAISMMVLAAAGPFTGERNWDAGVSLLMGLLCFATAPWAVGELLRKGPSRLAATVAWLWSAGWSYDLYWYFRRGFHPDDWLYNFLGSSLLYLAAGILWNLDWSQERGLHAAFRASPWPVPPPSGFRRVAVPALVWMALVGASVFAPYLFLRP